MLGRKKFKSDIELWKKIMKWQMKYFDFSTRIFNQHFRTEEELLDVWSIEFLDKESMNAAAVGIWLESPYKKGMLNSAIFKIRGV